MDTRVDPGSDLDAALMARIAQGDRLAFEQLFRAYEHRVYRYLLGILRLEQTAEEVTGDVLLDVWKSASRFRGQSRVSTWIFAIAHHKAMDVLRRHVPEHIELRELAQVEDLAEGPEEVAIAGSLAHIIADALRELTPEHRAVLELTFTYGCSQAEIATIVGCPVNTVKTRVFYARQHLRKILERRGVRGEIS